MSTLVTTPDRLEMAKGKDLPVVVYLSSDGGFTVTGLTVSAYLAATKGGAAITSPDTRITLTEITTTPSDRRLYRGAIDSAVIDTLVDADTAPRWLRVYDATGAASDWYPVPVARDGYSVLS